MRHFHLINNIIGWIVFLLAALVYLLTLEPDRKSTRLNSSH